MLINMSIEFKKLSFANSLRHFSFEIFFDSNPSELVKSDAHFNYR